MFHFLGTRTEKDHLYPSQHTLSHVPRWEVSANGIPPEGSYYYEAGKFVILRKLESNQWVIESWNENPQALTSLKNEIQNVLFYIQMLRNKFTKYR